LNFYEIFIISKFYSINFRTNTSIQSGLTPGVVLNATQKLNGILPLDTAQPNKAPEKNVKQLTPTTGGAKTRSKRRGIRVKKTKRRVKK
jgi:hypothetical protein